MKVGEPYSPAIAIGGVGGSGTRVIAQIISDAGVQIGEDLNPPNDSLLYTFLFRRPELFSCSEEEFNLRFGIFKKLRTGQKSLLTDVETSLLETLSEVSIPQYDRDWSERRVAAIELKNTNFVESKPWGWKEPNTHFNIDRILKVEPNLKYLHVMRNGLDMAYSKNQNQLMLWGEYVFDGAFSISPYYSLKFWHLVHDRINRLRELYEDSIYIVNFDKLCLSPVSELSAVFEFLGIEISQNALQNYASKAILPKSVGRHQKYPLNHFDSSDVAFAQQMGF